VRLVVAGWAYRVLRVRRLASLGLALPRSASLCLALPRLASLCLALPRLASLCLGDRARTRGLSPSSWPSPDGVARPQRAAGGCGMGPGPPDPPPPRSCAHGCSAPTNARRENPPAPHTPASPAETPPCTQYSATTPAPLSRARSRAKANAHQSEDASHAKRDLAYASAPLPSACHPAAGRSYPAQIESSAAPLQGPFLHSPGAHPGHTLGAERLSPSSWPSPVGVARPPKKGPKALWGRATPAGEGQDGGLRPRALARAWRPSEASRSQSKPAEANRSQSNPIETSRIQSKPAEAKQSQPSELPPSPAAPPH
jgi:hypothetical protein